VGSGSSVSGTSGTGGGGGGGSGGSGGSSSSSGGSASPFDAQAAAADAHAAQTAAAFGALLSSVSDAPRARYSLAGLGFGLPLSRLHARYFGGELALVNLPGYGVDAFLTLRRLDTAGWREQTDADEAAAAGAHVATEATVQLQRQLQRSGHA
jgi:[3-methyl-2-oxobutanoate dehydrogenase (acetyl-transferring)] kinase